MSNPVVSKLFRSNKIHFWDKLTIFNWIIDIWKWSKTDQNWSIIIEIRSKLQSSIQSCHWNPNWTKINNQNWPALNTNSRQFDSEPLIALAYSFGLIKGILVSCFVHSLHPFKSVVYLFTRCFAKLAHQIENKKLSFLI